MRAENLCAYCKHLKQGFTCSAFPNGIPQFFLQGKEHTSPYENDNGIVFEAQDDAPLWARNKDLRLK